MITRLYDSIVNVYLSFLKQLRIIEIREFKKYLFVEWIYVYRQFLNRVIIWSGYKRYGSTIERGSDRLGGSRSSRERKANTEGSPQAGWNLIFSKKAVDKWRLLSRPRSFLGQWYKMATVLRYLVHRTWIKDRERSVYIRHERCPVRASIDPWPRQSW